MAKGIINIAVGLILIGLIGFAFVNFGIGVASDNDANASILDDPRISEFTTSTDAQLDQFNDAANTSRLAFVGDVPVIGVSLQILSAASIWRTIITIPISVYDLTIGLVVDVIFGGAQGGFAITFVIIGALILVGVLFWSWSFIRSGRPD